MAREENQQQDQQNQTNSSIDRVNNVIRKGHSAFNNAKKLRNAYRGIRTARTAAAGAQAGAAVAEGAAATSPVWGTAAIIIAIAVLLVSAVFIIVLGGEEGLGEPGAESPPPSCESIGGTCQTSSSCAPPTILDTSGASCSASASFCCAPPVSAGCSIIPTCTSGDYLSCLKNQFGITMAGSFTSSDLKIIYDGFAPGFSYPTFLSWFKSVNPTVTVSTYDVCPSTLWCSGAWATVQSGARMTLYQKFLNSSSGYQKVVLVHEAGHIAIQANTTASNAQYTLYTNAYTNGLDRDCYDELGVLDTYPSNLIPSSQLNYDRKVRESWAESVADSVLCPINTTCASHGGGGTSIYSFPSTCSYIYNYVTTTLGC